MTKNFLDEEEFLNAPIDVQIEQLTSVIKTLNGILEDKPKVLKKVNKKFYKLLYHLAKISEKQ